MKLAEALIQRADLQRKISEIEERLHRIAKIQEGEAPAENPEELLKELDSSYISLEKLIKKINKANSTIIMSNDKTIVEFITERDIISKKRNSLDMLLRNASTSYHRQSKSEVKFITTIDITNVQKEIDLLAKRYREIDNQIQAQNWTTELPD